MSGSRSSASSNGASGATGPPVSRRGPDSSSFRASPGRPAGDSARSSLAFGCTDGRVFSQPPKASVIAWNEVASESGNGSSSRETSTSAPATPATVKGSVQIARIPLSFRSEGITPLRAPRDSRTRPDARRASRSEASASAHSPSQGPGRSTEARIRARPGSRSTTSPPHTPANPRSPLRRRWAPSSELAAVNACPSAARAAVLKRDFSSAFTSTSYADTPTAPRGRVRPLLSSAERAVG